LSGQSTLDQKRILSVVSGAVLPIVALGFIKALVDYIKPGATVIVDNSPPKKKKDEEEENLSLNVDEQTKFNDYDTEISNIEATIEMNIKLDERVKARKEVVTEPIHAEVISDKPKWKNSGEFLKSVASASSGGTIDKRLRNAEGANEAVGSEGGFW